MGLGLMLSALGCGEPKSGAIAGCQPDRPRAAGTTAEMLDAAGGPRRYLLHVPASYTGRERVPLVLNFHGYGGNGARQNDYSGLVPVSDANGFILVSPDALPTMNGRPFWNNLLLPDPPHANDVAFVDTLLDALEAELCVDPSRIYATGMSNGALMSSRLACSLSSRIAAVAPVAGAYYPPLVTDRGPEPCADTRPVPIVGFHGTLDPQVPFNGGPSTQGGIFRLPLDNATSDEDVLQDWAAHNGCTGGRQESPISSEVRLVTYGGCTDGADVQLYIVEGGGHTWPGSHVERPPEHTTQDISASDLMWRFFEAHPMRQGPQAADRLQHASP
jgi:polyhydroxybutyrate depolymerase